MPHMGASPPELLRGGPTGDKRLKGQVYSKTFRTTDPEDMQKLDALYAAVYSGVAKIVEKLAREDPDAPGWVFYVRWVELYTTERSRG